MASIDDFKANLIGGGARANQFRVTITPPPGIAIGLDVRRTSFLATATNLPGMTLGEVAVPFLLIINQTYLLNSWIEMIQF